MTDRMTVLLIVRTRAVADGAIEALHDVPVDFEAASSAEEVEDILTRAVPDHVIFGGGLDVQTRLHIIERVYAVSDATTVHMNAPAGPASYLPFVRAVLTTGLLAAPPLVTTPHA